MFNFRLSGIMHLYEHKEKQCREELARCLASLREAESAEAALEEKRRNVNEDLAKKQEGCLELPRLSLNKDYLQFLNEQLLLQQEIVRVKNAELAQARQNLLAARREKRVLEKLRDKQYQQFLYEENKAEQALLDELSKTGLG